MENEELEENEWRDNWWPVVMVMLIFAAFGHKEEQPMEPEESKKRCIDCAFCVPTPQSGRSPSRRNRDRLRKENKNGR